MSEDDDIEAYMYLTTFERVMTTYGVDKSHWAFKTHSLLARHNKPMSTMESGDYEALKAAILRRYNICKRDI